MSENIDWFIIFGVVHTTLHFGVIYYVDIPYFVLPFLVSIWCFWNRTSNCNAGQGVGMGLRVGAGHVSENETGGMGLGIDVEMGLEMRLRMG